MAVKILFPRLAFFLFFFGCQGQTIFGQSYKALIRQADSLYKGKNYPKSIETYSEAFKLEKRNPNHLYNAARSAALAGDQRNAFECLELALENGWVNIDRLKKDTDLDELHNNKKWPRFLDKVQGKVNAIEANYDKSLRGELLAILSDDQMIRNQLAAATKKMGRENPMVARLAKVKFRKDSINLMRVKKILDERGWVGKDKVGEPANQTLFLVIRHSDLKTQEKYLPLLRDAVKKGNESSDNLALLEDRVALQVWKKQIFGSQIHQDERTGKFYIAPLEDPDNVDKRRAKIGLRPISEYVRQWGINWSLENYKRQLPELELLYKKNSVSEMN